MNQDIIDDLEILKRYHQARMQDSKPDFFRYRAYENSINAIKKIPFKITSIQQIKNIPGIGKRTIEKVKEFLESGKIKAVEVKRSEVPEKNILEDIWGIGPETAKKLLSKGYKTIKDLKKAVIKNPNLLTNQQKIGLKYYEEFMKKIPRQKIFIFEVVFRYILNEKFGKGTYKLQIAGSYRRGLPFSGDIDMLLTSKKFNLIDAVNAIHEWGIISDILSVKKEKFMGVIHCKNDDKNFHRLDIEFPTEEQWGSTLLYFTGSERLNKKMRIKANKQGLKLSEHGLFKNDIRLPIYDEKDFFKALGMPYLEPKDR